MIRPGQIPTPGYWAGREPIYRTLAPLIDAIGRVLLRVEARHLERIPRTGPAILMANHGSHLDILVLLRVCRRVGRRVRFLALADLWRVPVLGWLLDKGRMVPVHRGSGGAGAGAMVQGACAALEAGELIVVFPEGRITPPGEEPRARRGAGVLALAADAPVLPVALHGVPRWTGRFPGFRRRVLVAIGEPVPLETFRDGTARDGTARDAALGASRAILARVHALLDGLAA